MNCTLFTLLLLLFLTPLKAGEITRLALSGAHSTFMIERTGSELRFESNFKEKRLAANPCRLKAFSALIKNLAPHFWRWSAQTRSNNPNFSLLINHARQGAHIDRARDQAFLSLEARTMSAFLIMEKSCL